jgi:hypothetical protein
MLLGCGSSVSTPAPQFAVSWGLRQVDGVQGDTPPPLVGTLRHFEVSQLMLSLVAASLP